MAFEEGAERENSAAGLSEKQRPSHCRILIMVAVVLSCTQIEAIHDRRGDLMIKRNPRCDEKLSR
jgi:hypothetical protein